MRTINSRNQELESQLRTIKVDYEGQLRTKNNYIREIKKLINVAPLDLRNNQEQMIYCAMRVLRIPPEKRKELVLSFDEEVRINYINNFIE